MLSICKKEVAGFLVTDLGQFLSSQWKLYLDIQISNFEKGDKVVLNKLNYHPQAMDRGRIQTYKKFLIEKCFSSEEMKNPFPPEVHGSPNATVSLT